MYDYDDDGETGAGKKLLELIKNNLNVNNIAVMVSRWYGGINLGPARFKMIKDVALILLRQHDIL